MSRTIRRKNLEREGPTRGGSYHSTFWIYCDRYVKPHYPDYEDQDWGKPYPWYKYAAHRDMPCNSAIGVPKWCRKVEEHKHRGVEARKIRQFLKGVTDDVVLESRITHECWLP